MSSTASADATAIVACLPAAVRFYRFSARSISVLAIAVGLVILYGWGFDIASLKTVLPGLVAMNPTTATGFMLAGLSLCLLCGESASSNGLMAARIFATLILLMGALKLIQLLHGPDLAVDKLLFRSHNVAGNPMAPNTAVCFVLCGTVLLTLDLRLRHGVRPSQVCALVAVALSLFAVIGYAFNVSALYVVKSFFPMAMHTAAMFLLLSTGILCARPDRGLMKVLSVDSAAGAIARRLLPVMLGLPAILGLTGEFLQRAGVVNPLLKPPLVVLADTVIFTTLVWWELELLRRADVRRLKTEQALRTSEARTRQVIDSARDAFVAIDSSGAIVDWNPLAQEMFGYSHVEAMGLSTANTIFPVGQREEFEAGVRQFLETGQAPLMGRRLEMTAMHRSGREFPVELVVSPARINNAWFFFAFIHDITARRRVAEERDRFFTLGLDMVCVSDFEGYFKRVNGAFETTLGYTPVEMMSRRWIEFVHPEDVETTLAEARKLAAGAVTIAFENRYRCKDGSYKWLMWTSVPVVKDQLLYAVARDMTERKRSEAELREKNRLLECAIESERSARKALQSAQGQLVQSEKLAGLGQMVAGVAHEINNPLSFVSNNVAVLQRDVAAVAKLLGLYERAEAAGPEARPGLLEEIRQSAERVDLSYTISNLSDLIDRSREGLKRIQQIVKDLRDFARLDESALQEADLNAGVESTINIVRGHAKKRQVQIFTDLHPLPHLRCYPAKLNQVIMNLIVNAIDASHPESAVTVRTCALDENGVRIDVIDQGQGIDPKIRERIFDPFFTTKPIGEGTGLGLSISYGIVRDHHGRIEVQSEPGKGSTFSVFLPNGHTPTGEHASAPAETD
jgi:two-component system NtrC family sensor kinase